MCFLSTTFPNAPTHPHHPPILFDQSLTTTAYDAYQFQGQKQSTEDRQGAAYKIKCCDCQATYIGETNRNLSTRLTEHKRSTRNGDVNNYLIAEHH